MGWVEKTFLDEVAFRKVVPVLWNEVRDSIGTSREEFNKRMAGSTTVTFSTEDCKSLSAYCLRIRTVPFSTDCVELFLNDGTKTLMMKRGTVDDGLKRICGYRLKGDRSSAEFFVELPDGGTSPISVESACEMALHEFLFVPFPI